MIPAEYDAMSAIDKLRLTVRNFNACDETFNQRHTIPGLLAIHRAWMLSAWDFAPDQWELRQGATLG